MHDWERLMHPCAHRTTYYMTLYHVCKNISIKFVTWEVKIWIRTRGVAVSVSLEYSIIHHWPFYLYCLDSFTGTHLQWSVFIYFIFHKETYKQADCTFLTYIVYGTPNRSQFISFSPPPGILSSFIVLYSHQVFLNTVALCSLTHIHVLACAMIQG